MAYKYAKDLVTIKSTQTFSIEPYFFRAQSKNEESPLMIIGPTSRFRATIINKERVAVTARWTPKEVISMTEDFKTARSISKELIWKRTSPAAATRKEPAFCIQITAGKMKGMTPAAALLAGTWEAELKNHYKWLNANLSQYPNNQQIMDAIQNAFDLQKAGTLGDASQVQEKAVPVMRIFESSMKPLIRDKKENGKCPVYTSRVSIYPTDNYPVEIVITTFDAPVETKPDGRLNVQARAKEHEVTNTMRMSFEDFGYVLEEMVSYMELFKMCNVKACFADAEACDQENRRAARQRAVS